MALPYCLVLLAHMDDESISSAGYIQSRVAMGYGVKLVAVFDRKYDYGKGEQHIQEQKTACNEACGLLGITSYHLLHKPEGDPYQVLAQEVLKELETIMLVSNPVEVVIPDPRDRNLDHQWLHNLCKIVLRPWANPTLRRVLMAQALDAVARECNYFVPLTKKMLAVKLKAIACYDREARISPHPRSPELIKANAVVSGSHCHEMFAEPYRLFYQKD